MFIFCIADCVIEANHVVPTVQKLLSICLPWQGPGLSEGFLIKWCIFI